MESDHPEHVVPLHPWEGGTAPPSAIDDEYSDDVDPVGPGPVDDDAVLNQTSGPDSFLSSQLDGPTSPALAQAVYGAGQSAEQVIGALRDLRSSRPDLAAMATRLTPDVLEAVQLEFPSVAVHETANACVLGELVPPRGRVCVIAGGRSDADVAHEAAVSARVFGAEAEVLSDVRAAEIHELLTSTKLSGVVDCLIVVSGMEGSFPSSISSRTSLPVVAVPTSVGYGSSFGGVSALLAMLNACAPGVVVCNIDNGFGAGVFAARVARAAHRVSSTLDPPAAG